MTAELSYAEVQRIMRFHLDYLHEQGVARSGGDLPVGPGPQVVESEDAVDYILRRAAVVDFFPRGEAVRLVVDAQLAYFEAIGTISPVTPPEWPSSTTSPPPASMRPVPRRPARAERPRSVRAEAGDRVVEGIRGVDPHVHLRLLVLVHV